MKWQMELKEMKISCVSQTLREHSTHLGQFISHVLLGLLTLFRVHVQEVAHSAVHALVVDIFGSAVIVICPNRKED